MLLLAQSTPPPGFTAWIESGFYMVGLVTAVVVLWKQFAKAPPAETEIKGQPITVRADTEYTTKEETDALEARVEARFAALDKSRRENVEKLHDKFDHLEQRTQQVIAEMRREVKDDVTGMHKRTDVILEKLSELRGAVNIALKNSNPPFKG